MKSLVTGAAGFIGSTLCEKLIESGNKVIGVDNFAPFYSRLIKEQNLERCQQSASFEFHEIDLARDDLGLIMHDVSHVYHLAGQPGVRDSWGDEFSLYSENNLVGTHRLLQNAREQSSIKAFVAASSSSVYGECQAEVATEDLALKPISPYGITKMASEALCVAFGTELGLPTISLRFFTVYGPRQRPDMAIHRLIRTNLLREQFVLFGDGSQERDFTFVDDVVEACITAAHSVGDSVPFGTVMNVGGGRPISLASVISMIESETGLSSLIKFAERQPGDPSVTRASTRNTTNKIGWVPTTLMSEGIRRQVKWQSLTQAKNRLV